MRHCWPPVARPPQHSKSRAHHSGNMRGSSSHRNLPRLLQHQLPLKNLLAGPILNYDDMIFKLHFLIPHRTPSLNRGRCRFIFQLSFRSGADLLSHLPQIATHLNLPGDSGTPKPSDAEYPSAPQRCREIPEHRARAGAEK